jgi:hypothetical protein
MDRKKKEPIEPDPEEVFEYLFADGPKPPGYDERLPLYQDLQYQETYPIIILSDDSDDSGDSND